MSSGPADRPSEESLWASTSGQRWASHIDQFEGMINPIGDALIAFASFQSGETIVDIGCGAGPTTLAAAACVGSQGLVTGLDISPDLIAEATRRAAFGNVRQARFVLGDAAKVTLDTQAADCVMSRFGVMFFSDPYAAFKNIYRFVKPGGE